MYIKIVDGRPVNYSVQQLREDHPNTSFPTYLSDELLEEWGVFKVERTKRPSHNPNTQRVVSAPVKQVDGVWKQQWVVEDIPSYVLKDQMESKRKEAYEEEADPLFFKWQRGEVDKQEWLNKVKEIKKRYPY